MATATITPEAPVNPKFAARVSARVRDRLDEELGSINPRFKPDILAELIRHANDRLNAHTTEHHRATSPSHDPHFAITEETEAELRQRARDEVRREIKAQRRAARVEKIHRGLGRVGIVKVTPVDDENKTWLERRVEGVRNRATKMTEANLGVFATRLSEAEATHIALFTMQKRQDGKLQPVRLYSKRHARKTEDAGAELEVAKQQQSVYLSARSEALNDAAGDSTPHAGFRTRRHASSLRSTIAELGDDHSQARSSGNRRRAQSIERQLGSARGHLDRVMGHAALQVMPAIAEIRTIASQQKA